MVAMYPLCEKNARTWFGALLLLGSVASNWVGAQDAAPAFGLDHLLRQTPGLAETIRPVDVPLVADGELNTPARRDFKPGVTLPEIPAAEPNIVIDWNKIRREIRQATKKPTPKPAVEDSKGPDPKPEQLLRVTAQDRLLFSVSVAPKEETRARGPIAGSDLGTFRAQALSAGAPMVLPSSDKIFPVYSEFKRHETSKKSGQALNYANPE